MKLKDFSKYLGMFVFAVLLIAVYKTFDNLHIILGWIGTFFSILTPFIIGLGVAFLLYPPCRKLENYLKRSKYELITKHRRAISVFTVFFLFLCLIAGIIWLLIPSLAKSAVSLGTQLPSMIETLKAKVDQLDFIQVDLRPLLNKISLEQFFGNFNLTDISKYTEGVIGISMALFHFVIGLIISIYILLDRSDLKQLAARLSGMIFKKQKKYELIRTYYNRTCGFLYSYIYTKIIAGGIVFLVTLVIFLAMKIPYAPLMALMTGVFDLVPYFGSFISCIITVVTTMAFDSLSKGIWILVILIVIQQLDGNVLQPKLVNQTMKIKPLWVLFAILVGGGLFGLWGMILSVPALALIKSIFEDYMDWKDDKHAQPIQAPEEKEQKDGK